MKECCILRGAWVKQFVEYADRAGALLPEWPATSYPALLHDVQMWQTRVRRREELAQEQFFYVTPDGSPPNGEAIPPDQVVNHYWESTRASSYSSGLVTDHRGHVERWLGYVFAILKENQPEAIEIRSFPEEVVGVPTNAILTLRQMNLFQASARAIELSGILPPAPAPTAPVPTGSQANSGADRESDRGSDATDRPNEGSDEPESPGDHERAKLRPAEAAAWTQYARAESGLLEEEGVGDPTDEQAYKWLIEEEILKPETTLSAWKRALGRARKKLGKGKYQRRPGYTGRSAVPKDELNDRRSSEV